MSVYREMYIFVEGERDRLFFDEIIKPMIGEEYDLVEVTEWAQERKGKIDNYLKSIKSENWNADYILVTDMDTPCVTAKKEEIQKRFRNVDQDKIIVVRKEIESWYLAVLKDDRCEKLGVSLFAATDEITKEQFGGVIPTKFDSDIDFMQEILKSFDIETAKRKNKSFRYFVKKYGLQG